MPTLRKKSGRRITAKRVDRTAEGYVGDVTINDFANSWRSHARVKKAAMSVSSELKQEAAAQNEVKDSWEELDDDYVCGDQFEKIEKVAPTNHRRNRKGKPSENEEQEAGGVDYPLDVWFLISEYISPEAVGKFARICKSSYYVTTTGKFWFHLYKSYYTFKPGIPIRLQPQCMVRTHGLRACVIRMLHYTYFALKKEKDGVSYLRDEEPHSLVKKQCCVMWSEKHHLNWHFFFKLKEIPKTRGQLLRGRTDTHSKKTDFLEMLDDVGVNRQEGCKLLKVICLKYSMLPPVIGLILQTVSVHLMPGFKQYRLHLGFGTSDIPNTLTHQVILTDVVSYKVLNWWHPCYPHLDATTIELPRSDSWE